MAITEITRGATLGDGRYRLERLLGTGGMASVWLAHDRRLRRDVAVKVLSDVLALDAEYVARFAREARIAARLSHPGLVGVLDFGTDGDRPYLVQEYVRGGTLADRLRNPDGGELDPVALARQLLDALGHMHRAGIVHRDVKPADILLGADGRVRLADFGIAQRCDATGITGTGFVLGTAKYCAPEVLRGLPSSPRSDLYALGVVLGECAGDGAPAELWWLVAELTRPAPADRPASAEDAARLLPNLAAAGPTAAGRGQDGGRTLVLPTEVVAAPAEAGGLRSRIRTAIAVRAERRAHVRLLRPRVVGTDATFAGVAALALAAVLSAPLPGGAQTPDGATPPPHATSSDPLLAKLDRLDRAIDLAGK